MINLLLRDVTLNNVKKIIHRNLNEIQLGDKNGESPNPVTTAEPTGRRKTSLSQQ